MTLILVIFFIHIITRELLKVTFRYYIILIDFIINIIA